MIIRQISTGYQYFIEQTKGRASSTFETWSRAVVGLYKTNLTRPFKFLSTPALHHTHLERIERSLSEIFFFKHVDHAIGYRRHPAAMAGCCTETAECV